MKQTLFLLVVLVASLLSSCQCADKPDVPPVEDTAAAMIDLTTSPTAVERISAYA